MSLKPLEKYERDIQRLIQNNSQKVEQENRKKGLYTLRKSFTERSMDTVAKRFNSKRTTLDDKTPLLIEEEFDNVKTQMNNIVSSNTKLKE